jgi:hypothetical protein
MEIRHTLNPQPFRIPYQHAPFDGGEQHRSVDLVAEPRLVNVVPEAAECPKLRELLAWINRLGLPYRSIGCG